MRQGKWKLVAKADQPWELYDMETDRTEMHDLAAREPRIAAELEAKWDAWATRADVLPLGAWRGLPTTLKKKSPGKKKAPTSQSAKAATPGA